MEKEKEEKEDEGEDEGEEEEDDDNKNRAKLAFELLQGYQKEMESIGNRFGVKTEIELFMNSILSYKYMPGLKNFDVERKISTQVNTLKYKFRGIFFREFLEMKEDKCAETPPKVLNDYDIGYKFIPKSFEITEGMKKKAALWCWVSLAMISKDSEVVLGFPFVVYDILCSFS